MVRMRTGVVRRIVRRTGGVTEAVVLVAGEERVALNYEGLTGALSEGDEVVVNLTAVDLGVGTSGFDFVVWNLRYSSLDIGGPGHIFKLRYTPLQFACLAAEEQGSEHHSLVEGFAGLRGRPVVAAELHSMVAPVAAGVRSAAGEARVAYLMTDGASLPAGVSLLLARLRTCGLVNSTITTGQAFGGDHEAVNIYSGLAVAAAVAGADVVIVAPGPGVVGTDTRYGHSAVQQGEVLNAVAVLGGRGIAVPRISFADPRERHRGLSHHSRVALGEVALARSTVVLPEGEGERFARVREEMKDAGICERHAVASADGSPALRILEDLGLTVSTMGRSPVEDPLFFLAAGAAGVFAGRAVAGEARAWRDREGAGVAKRGTGNHRAFAEAVCGQGAGTSPGHSDASRREAGGEGGG